MSVQEKRRSGLFVILILMIIFAVLVCLYYLIGHLAQQPESEESSDSIPALTGIDIQQIDTFSYDCNGIYQTFLKTDGQWIYAEDTEMTMDQDMINSMLSSLCDLKYEQIISDKLSSSAEYGFNDPSNTIVLGFQNGTQKILYIGSENPMTGIYYAITEGDEHIYAVSSEVPSIFLPAEQLAASDDSEDISEGGDASDDGDGISD